MSSLEAPSPNQVQIGILDDYAEIAVGHFKSVAPSTTLTVINDTLPPYSHPSTTQDEKNELVKRFRPFTIISTMRERTAFPEDLLKQLPNLKLLLTTGMRNASIDMEAAKARGIVVTGTQAKKLQTAKNGADSTTEHTWALLLALVRGVARDDVEVKGGGWQTGLATGLSGKTLGIAGLGRLGTAVAKIGVIAFGMKVVAWSTSLTQDTADVKAKALGLPVDDTEGNKTFKVVTKDELFSTSDVLSIHYALSARSRGIVAKTDLQRMKPTAFLVNTSRGPLVDEAALLEVAKAGTIRGVALDVFELEPLPKDSPWRSTNWGRNGTAQVLLSPHMGYVEEAVMNEWYRETAENVERFLKGEEVLNRII